MNWIQKQVARVFNIIPFDVEKAIRWHRRNAEASGYHKAIQAHPVCMRCPYHPINAQTIKTPAVSILLPPSQTRPLNDPAYIQLIRTREIPNLSHCQELKKLVGDRHPIGEV
jgi:hypothetical protein